AFDLEMNGSNEINGQISSENLEIESNGLNNCRLRGKTKAMNIELNGAGQFDFKNLEAEETRLEAGGGAKISLRSTRSLKAEANGLTQVVYYGNPSETRFEANGGSSIVKGQ